MISNRPHNHMNQINPNQTQLPHCKYLQTSHVAPGQIDRTYTRSHKRQPHPINPREKAVSIQSETANLLTQRSPTPPPQPLGKPCTQSPVKLTPNWIAKSQNPNPTQPNIQRNFWNRPKSANTMQSLVPLSFLLLLLLRRRRRTARCTTLSKMNHRIPTLNCTQHIPPLLAASAMDPPPQLWWKPQCAPPVCISLCLSGKA